MKDVLFVCLHGSAKSLIAAEHFSRLAKSRGLAMRGVSRGVEPDDSVPPPVINGLKGDGVDVATYRPQPFHGASLAGVAHVVTFGCDIGALPAGVGHDDWADLPMVSDGFGPARDAIVQRVTVLAEKLGTEE